MEMGRTYTYRKLTSYAWITMPDGSKAGIIELQLFEDQAHTKQIGGSEFYIGAIKDGGGEETAISQEYAQAREIVAHGRKLPKKLIERICETRIMDNNGNDMIE